MLNSLIGTCRLNGVEPETWLRYVLGLQETAKMNGLEPHVWLTDVLKRLPSWPEERLNDLQPFPSYRFSDQPAL